MRLRRTHLIQNVLTHSKDKLQKRRNLNGLPNSLIQRYFSSLFYYQKGYMADWIWNSATEKKIDKLTIDFINDQVDPKELQIKPIIAQLPKLRETIKKSLKIEEFSEDFITEGKFHILIIENENSLKCLAELNDIEGNKYVSNEYTEQSYDNDFRVFNARSINDRDWQNAADTALNTSEWFGAIIRYFVHLGKKKFNRFYNQKELKKNAIIGNIFQIVLMILFFFILYQLYN